jgi:hypothetical protein
MVRLSHLPARLWMCIVLAAVAVGATAVTAIASGDATMKAHKANTTTKAYKANITYVETDHGTQNGTATVGVKGHGKFSATLRGGAALEAAVLAAVTGVPLTKIAKGGTYTVQRSFLADGSISGLAVGKFKARGLGSVCVSYTMRFGMLPPGGSFAPAIGTLTTKGGTGAAATWRVHVSFKQTGISGVSTENLAFAGSAHAGTGKPKPMSAACKRVAALHG